MRIAKLVGTKYFVATLPVSKIKEHKIGFVTIYAMALPSLLVVEEVTDYSDGVKQLRYYDGKMSTAVVLPDGFELDKATGLRARILGGKYEDHLLKNISGEIRYPGGTLGSDPEFFVEDEKGQIIPAFDFLGGKKAPNRVRENDIYWDGFQAEFTTNPKGCLAYHCDSIHNGLRGLHELAKVHSGKAKISAKTVFDIPAKLLKDSKKEHVEFGCNPSKNIYKMEGLSLPGREVNYRSAGGHIHFGTGPMDNARLERIIKAMDATIAVACVSLFASFDDPRRRRMYGLAGEYRTPAHGMEYRVLSNAWMFHPMIANVVVDSMRKAMGFGDRDLMKHWKTDEAETIETINKCDYKNARKIMQKNKTLFLQIFKAAYPSYSEKSSEVIYNMFYDGMESVVKDPTDITNNWLLDAEWVTHCNANGKNWVSGYNIVSNKKKVS